VNKFIIIYFSIFSILLAQKNVVVPTTLKPINYKKMVNSENSTLKKVTKNRFCKKKYVDIEKWQKNKYRTKRYIPKNKPICLKDVYIPSSKKIKFNFGLLEIERDGEIVKETDSYIRIKNLDGTRETIYKDGREK
jgi:hypothetical protein